MPARIKSSNLLSTSSLSGIMRRLSSRKNKKDKETEGQSSTKEDDKFSLLAKYDIKLLIDDSYSMRGKSWKQVKDTLGIIAPICTKYDANGIDIHFLNHRDDKRFENITSNEAVDDIFEEVQPNYSTPTGARLKKILHTYIDEYEYVKKHQKIPNGEDLKKPLNLIVITDGKPDENGPQVEDVLVEIGERFHKLDPPVNHLGVQFCQIGEDKGAAEALRKIDDNLFKDREFDDFVDHLECKGALNGDDLLKCVLGGIHRRFDRRPVETK